MKRILSLINVGLLLLVLTGCPSVWNTEKTEAQSAEKMWESAESHFNKKDYNRAIELYEQIKSAYPDFKEIPTVYLRIADSYYDDKAYEKAIGRYYQFVELYPNHKEAARAKYQTGMSLFNQIKKTDLDSRIIQKTAETFKALADDENAGEWAKKAEEKYRECRQKLAEKEWDKLQTYISMGNYNSARQVAKRIQDEYPNLGFDEKISDLVKKIKNK